MRSYEVITRRINRHLCMYMILPAGNVHKHGDFVAGDIILRRSRVEGLSQRKHTGRNHGGEAFKLGESGYTLPQLAEIVV